MGRRHAALPGWVPARGGSLAQCRLVSAEDIIWVFEFMFPFEIWVCFAEYSEES